MGAVSLLTRGVSLADQRVFSHLSGDYNPIHLDQGAARRELHGQRLVYGVFLVLAGLERYFSDRHARIFLNSLTARFLAPVFLNEPVELRVSEQIERQDAREVTILLVARQLNAVQIRFCWRESEWLAEPEGDCQAPRRQAPLELEADQLAELQGQFVLRRDVARMVRLFPSLARILPPHQWSSVLGTTRLVGMICPGLRSIFSSLTLGWNPAEPDNLFRYRVEQFSEIYRMVSMVISGTGWKGRLEAFLRPKPSRQPSYSEVAAATAGRHSVGNALVVGGSRGLGELTAKILAACGARVMLTYQHSEREAQELASSLRGHGADCTCLRFDASRPESLEEALRQAEFRPDQVYYYPSPKIFRSKAGVFNSQVFQDFCQVYVSAFQSVYEVCRRVQPGQLRLFYPSTEALDTPHKGLAEYSAAKAAGEQLCLYLERADPLTRILVRRLPRLATDQTLSMVGTGEQEALPILQQVVADMGQQSNS